MQLIPYNPIRDLLQADKELGKLFGNGWTLPSLSTDESTVDLYTEDGKVIAEVALPNFNKEEVKVTADENGLTIVAEHEEKEENKDKRRYFLRESSRSYQRRISLPAGAETDEATASFEDGKLRVTMPLEEEKKTKEVVIT
jgi:HSP20 family protein